MPKRVIDTAEEIYAELVKIGIGKKITAIQLRDLITLTAGGFRSTVDQYCRLLEHFGYIKPGGEGKIEILKKKR